jgi:hypothetical protein
MLTKYGPQTNATKVRKIDDYCVKAVMNSKLFSVFFVLENMN